MGFSTRMETCVRLGGPEACALMPILAAHYSCVPYLLSAASSGVASAAQGGQPHVLLPQAQRLHVSDLYC